MAKDLTTTKKKKKKTNKIKKTTKNIHFSRLSKRISGCFIPAIFLDSKYLYEILISFVCLSVYIYVQDNFSVILGDYFLPSLVNRY